MVKRTPRNYAGTTPVSHTLDSLLPEILHSIDTAYNKQPRRVLQAWPEIIGQKLAPMTVAVSLIEGVLTVRVKNATLYSLLVQHEKERLLKALQKKFSKGAVCQLVFKVG